MIKSENNYSLNRFLLLLNLLLFLSRGYSPIIIRIFAITFSLSFAYLLIKNYSFIINRNFFVFLKPFVSFFFIGIIFIISLSFSEYKPVNSFKESLNFIALTGFVVFLIVSIKNINDWKLFKKIFYVLYVTFYVLIVIISILLSFKTNNVSFYKVNISLFNDYNFFALNVLIAFLIIVFLINKTTNKTIISLYNIALLFFSYLLLNTNSRRAIIILFVVNIFLFIYNILQKRLYKYFVYYFSFLIVFVIVGLMFILTSGHSRSYIFDKTFTNSKKVKNVTALTTYRYSTILGLKFNFKDIKSFLWEETPVYNKKLVDNYVYRKHIKIANENLKNNDYKSLIDNLILAGKFKKSGLQYKNDMPSIFGTIPDSLIELIPYMYNFNYTYNNLFIHHNKKSLFLSDTSEVVIKDTSFKSFIFSCGNSNVVSGYTELIGLQGNTYKLEVLIKKPTNSQFSFNFKNTNENYADIITTYDSVPLSKDYYKYSFKIHIIKNSSLLIKFNYIFKNVNYNDTITISDFSYSQVHAGKISLNSYFRDSHKYKYVYDYYNRIKNREHWINMFISNWKKKQGKKHSIVKADSSIQTISKFIKLQDSLYLFHKYVNTKLINIYSNHCDFIITGNNSFPRGSILLPAIKSGRYSITLQYRTSKDAKLLYYIKRYPELLDYQFRYKILKKEESTFINGWHKISLDYDVTENTSVQAFFVFGIQPGFLNDTIQIKDFSIKYIHYLKSDTLITLFQYNEMKRLLNIYEKKSEQNHFIKLLRNKEKQFGFTYNNNDSVSTNRMFESRLNRWNFAWEYFKKYSTIQKMFGKGFEYNEVYSWKYSNKGKRITEFDYPHNPIISSFLYSGIIGGVVYIWFLILTFYYYWKYRKYHIEFFLIYILIFFFVFFSGNSHFSVPIFGVFSLFPFFTKYLVEKEDKTKLNPSNRTS